MPQLRQFTRFSLKVPVVFAWEDEGGEHAAQGVIKNISAGGMFIVSSVCPPVTSSVRCEMLVPPLDGGNIGEFEGAATGSVVRNEINGESGFAVYTSDFVVRQRQ